MKQIHAFILAFLGCLTTAHASEVTVVDAYTKAPIARVEVLVGHNLKAAQENLFTTDSAGKATWAEQADEISLYAPGYHLLTIEWPKDLTAVTLELVPQVADAEKTEIKGRVNGYGRLTTDGFADVTLATAAPTLLDFIALDKSRFLGPKVRMSLGMFDVNVPGNVDIPRQTETYQDMFPLTLDKPGFQLFVPPSLQAALYGLHVQMPFNQGIDVLRSKKGLVNLINNLRIKSLAVERSRTYMQGDSTDLELTLALAPKHDVKPTLNTPGWDRVYASVAQWSESGTAWMPLDLKILSATSRKPPSALKLNGFSAAPTNVKTVIMNGVTHFPDDFSKPAQRLEVSAALSETSAALNETLLPLPTQRTLSNNKIQWQMKSVAAQNAIPQLMMHTLVIDATTKLQWTVVSTKTAEYSFPSWPSHWPTRQQLQLKSWLQTVLGLQGGKPAKHPQQFADQIVQMAVAKEL